MRPRRANAGPLHAGSSTRAEHHRTASSRACAVLRERIGVNTQGDSTGVRVTGLVPGGVAERAGVRVGDQVVRLGEVTVTGSDFGPAYRERYGSAAEGTPLVIVVRRGGQEVTLNGTVQFVTVTTSRIAPDPSAGARAVRVRNGIVRGETAGG